MNWSCLLKINLVRSQEFIGGVIGSGNGERTLQDRRSHVLKNALCLKHYTYCAGETYVQ